MHRMRLVGRAEAATLTTILPPNTRMSARPCSSAVISRCAAPRSRGATAGSAAPATALVFDTHAGAASSCLPGHAAAAHGIERPHRIGRWPAAPGVFGAVVADDEPGLEAQPAAHVGHDRPVTMASGRRLASACSRARHRPATHAHRHAAPRWAPACRRSRSASSGRWPALAPAPSRPRGNRCCIRMLHPAGGCAPAPRCARAAASGPASASMRPAQRKTLNSRTVLRRLAMRSRCSAAAWWRPVQRVGGLFDVVRVHDQRLGQSRARHRRTGSGSARPAVVARGDELLADQVHAVVQAGHDADVGGAEQLVHGVVLMVLASRCTGW
jgi:hypothetical protein